MIPASDRVKALALIDEACASGAAKYKACETLGLSVRTYQRWVAGGSARPAAVRAKPKNKLSEDEHQAILDCCNSHEFADLSPKQIVPRLIDQGIYMGSKSTILSCVTRCRSDESTR